MPLRVLEPNVIVTPASGGVVYLRSQHALGSYPQRFTDRLAFWAREAPHRVFLRDRETASADWATLTYAEALRRVRRIAQGLIDRGVTADRPVAVLSGNSIEHALLGLASMYCGVPYVPISPAYALGHTTFDTLRSLWNLLQPGLVFAADGSAFEPALQAVGADRIPIITSAGRRTTFGDSPFPTLEEREPSLTVDERRDDVTGSTVAKILFTSGSTGSPKGVITTHGMLAANQAQIHAMLPFLSDKPPLVCDWLPWNHTFGGSHNFGLVLYNGGTLTIDRGRPIAGAPFEMTVANLKDWPPTIYFNVPRSYELLAAALKQDSELRSRFFSQVDVLFCAAAALKSSVAEAMSAVAYEARGEGVPWMMALGATESSPFTFCTTLLESATSPRVGVPAPAIDVKLVPAGEFYEARLRGPNITPGYWKDPDLTQQAFDEEGFYRLGDLFRWVDPVRPGEGLLFEGRLNENFKLSSGTWVRVGAVRQAMVAHFGEFVQDVVVAAPDRDELTALVFPNIARCRQLAALDDASSALTTLRNAVVIDRFRALLSTMNQPQSGSAARITRLALLAEPPLLDAGEITDKGSLNQGAVRRRRAAVIDELYTLPEHTVLVPDIEGFH